MIPIGDKRYEVRELEWKESTSYTSYDAETYRAYCGNYSFDISKQDNSDMWTVYIGGLEDSLHGSKAEAKAFCQTYLEELVKGLLKEVGE